jgi:hypothetical protein
MIIEKISSSDRCLGRAQLGKCHCKHIDEEFVSFLANLYQCNLDPDDFYNTARQNGWGSWLQYGPYIFSYWDSSILQLSGQSFVPVGLPPPSEPIPFYANIADAHNPNLLPFWCAINGQGGYRWNGVWEVLGWYREAVFVPDYSNFNEDAVEVAAPIATYLTTELVAPIPPIVFSILEDLLGVNHGLDDEPAIYNLVRLMGQVLFGFSVEQGTDLPKILAKVELLYTDIGLPALPPFARHAYLQVTFPNGNKYVTRGGPQQDPAFWPFGYIETQQVNSSIFPITEDNFLDYGKVILFRQLVGYSALTESAVSAAMVSVSSQVNNCDIPYLLLTSNSNSYAFQSVSVVTELQRPNAQVWAPGAHAEIPCP